MLLTFSSCATHTGEAANLILNLVALGRSLPDPPHLRNAQKQIRRTPPRTGARLQPPAAFQKVQLNIEHRAEMT